jgi:hypothetical protein
MFKLAKAAVLVGLLSTLTACTGHVQNTKNNCSYDYPAAPGDLHFEDHRWLRPGGTAVSVFQA